MRVRNLTGRAIRFCGKVLAAGDVASAVDDAPKQDDAATLRAKLEAAGVKVDGRWKLARLRYEVDALG